MLLEPLDLLVFLGYAFLIMGMGFFVSREKEGHVKDSNDYFLASKALPWWAVGASLIASNISAEQFIGMSGSGFALGLAIATYEWMAAATLLVVAIFFLPIYLKKGIYTMPGFLFDRYDGRVRTTMAVFWLLLYVFVNLTSVLVFGGLEFEYHSRNPHDLQHHWSSAIRHALFHLWWLKGSGLDRCSSSGVFDCWWTQLPLTLPWEW